MVYKTVLKLTPLTGILEKIRTEKSLQRLKIICVLWDQISGKLECKVICKALHDVICKINKFIQMVVDHIKHQFRIQVLVFMH